MADGGVEIGPTLFAVLCVFLALDILLLFLLFEVCYEYCCQFFSLLVVLFFCEMG